MTLLQRGLLRGTAVLLFLSVVVYLGHYYHHQEFRRRDSYVSSANATLGFGGLFVVSGADSPRRTNIIQAANVTQIELTIPEQRRWTEEDKAELKEKAGVDSIGSLLAWLAHIHVLKSFLDSGLETALILEDDVDWDIHLRTIQAPIVSSSFRHLLRTPKTSSYYYGNPKDWDLLYMGHCGDYFGPADDRIVERPVLQVLTRLSYSLAYDISLPERDSLHPFTASFMRTLQIPEKTRIIHPSQYPLCTFAYAVTRDSATRLVNELALPLDSTDPSVAAYDVKILHACHHRDFRCFSVNPELFHHMEGDSWIKQVEHSSVGRPPVDASGYEQVMQRNESSNIGCGFYSKDFYFGDDLEKLRYLQEEVGRRGRCMKDGRSTESLELARCK